MTHSIAYSPLHGLEKTGVLAPMIPVTFLNKDFEFFSERFSIDICIAEGVHTFKCILGRKDLFKKAKITFEGYKNQFHVDFRRFN